MAMDEKGHLWIQNYDNLGTYNGFKFTYFYPDENNVYARPRKMTDIIADKNKKIWIASDDGLHTFTKSKGFLKHILFSDGKSFDNITTLHTNKDNKIWCGNGKGQIILYDPISECNLNEKTLPFVSKINSIFEDTLEQIWVSCDLGLYVYKVDGPLNAVYDYKNKSPEADLDCIKISDVVQRSNEIIINLNNELIYFDILNHSLTRSSALVNRNKTYKIKDYSGIKDNLFIVTTDNGIFFFNTKDNIAYIANPNSTDYNLGKDVVNRVILTENSVCLFGTNLGLSKLQYMNEPFKNISIDDVSPSVIVLADEIGKWEKDWLLVTSNGSMYRFRKNGRLITKLHSEKQNKLQKFCLSYDQNKLYTISDGQLFMSLIDKKSIGNSTFLVDTKLKSIKKIAADSIGNIWILSINGLHYYNTFQKLLTRVDVNDDELIDVEIFKNGLICVCGKKLYCAENGRDFKEISAIDNENIHDMEPGIYNDVYFSSFSGLYHYDFSTKKTDKYIMKDGMLSNDAGNIKMLDSSLWVTYASGLQKYNPKNKKFQSFNFESGLNKNDCYDDNIFAVGDEVLILGGNDHFTYYQKARRSPLKHVELNIESVYFDDKYVPEDGYNKYKIIVPADVKRIELKFDFPLFLQPSYYYLEYRLQSGKDITWYEMPTSMTLPFYKLKPNNYQLELRATDVNMPEFKKHFFINVDVLAPFYKKTSFQIILFFLLSCIITIVFYAVYRYKLNQIKRLDDLRMNISRDLHDEMGSELSSIKLLSELEVLKTKSDENSSFRKIAEKSTIIMESMSDIVWSINPANDEMSKIIEKIQQYTYDLLEPKDINVLMEIDENIKGYFFNIEKRRHFYLIFKESINNIAKYAKATEVIISISLKGNIIESSISDNGEGFYTLGKTQGNGLRNMKERAELIGANIEIRSNKNKGTTIHLSLKI